MNCRIISVLIVIVLCSSVCSCSEAITAGETETGTFPVTITTTVRNSPESITTDITTSAQQPEGTNDSTAVPSIITISPSPEPLDIDFVCVSDYIPSIYVELKYATADNFTGQVIYDFTAAYLRYGTVKKLVKVQDYLIKQGFSLKIWDAYRPVEAQFNLWEVCPDPQYVANPNKGYSSHSRGNTIDVTLVYLDGTEVLMPTGFDDFSKLADRDYSDNDAASADNALILETVMLNNGFTAYSGEWWHYSDTTSFLVEEAFTP